MFIEKWLPLRAIADESGADQTQIEDTGAEDTGGDAGADDGKPAVRPSIRKSLESGFDRARKAADETDGDKVPAKKGKSTKEPRRIAGGATVDAEAPADDAELDEEIVDETPQSQAPEAFSKEAKAEWANVPPNVQAAILKRETDTAKGVEELKGKYRDLDQALAPHMQAIRQNGHSPAQAVTQLFAWMQALAGNPDAAFPALAKSFGYDIARFMPKNAATQQPSAQDPNAAAAGQAAPAGIPPEVTQHIEQLTQKIAQLEGNFGTEINNFRTQFQRDTEEKTNQILTNWSNGKTHFPAVRGLMAQLLQSGAVPLKEGQVDLDAAYDMAINAHPQVRALVYQERVAAAKAAREAKAKADAVKNQDAANKARRASVSVGNNAPGEVAVATGGKRGKGLSVRESINQAREQLTE
jgi:hypothetical protein